MLMSMQSLIEKTKELLNNLGLSEVMNIIDMWMINAFLVIFLTLLINHLLKRFINTLEEKTKATKTPWDEAIIYSIRKPLSLLIWILGLCFAAMIINAVAEVDLSKIIITVRKLGIIICVLWFFVRASSQLEKNYITLQISEENNYDKTTAEAVGKLVRLALYITGTLIVLQTMGVSISGVLAFGGVGGIAIGFAAKDLLANFFGGLMIYLDRPFSKGDWIRSPEKEIEGTVEQIGWRLTRIRTFDMRPLYVPNSVFTSIVVENPSRMTNRRIKETIGIRYADVGKMQLIVKDVRAMLLAHDDIDKSKTLMVNFNAFNASSLDFFIYTFTKTTNWVMYHSVKQDVLLKIADIIEQHQAEIAFPSRSVYIENELASYEVDS